MGTKALVGMTPAYTIALYILEYTVPSREVYKGNCKPNCKMWSADYTVGGIAPIHTLFFFAYLAAYLMNYAPV